MAKRPCAKCKGKGYLLLPLKNTDEEVEIRRCERCEKFETHLRAGKRCFRNTRVIEFDGAIAIVVRKGDEFDS